MESQDEKSPKKATLFSIPDVCILLFLQYLDMLSLADICKSNKALHRDGCIVAEHIWRHLVADYLLSPYIRLPNVGGVGQKSYAISAYELFLRQEVLIMGGYNGGNGTNEVTKMIMDQDGTIRFEASTPMLQARYDQAVVYHQGEVFSISTGIYPAASHGTMERLDILTQTRTQLAERLPNSLKCTTAAMLGNKLLVVGGEHEIDEEDIESGNIYELDEHASQAAQGKWRAHEARLNTARSSAAAIAFEGKIFLCGGYAGAGQPNSVESFDPVVGAWQVEGDMINMRYDFSLFVFDDELYAVGGEAHGENTTIEKRNKATKQWELVADCGQRRRGCAAALVGSKIFLFGGYFHQSTFDYFDLHSKKWASKDVGDAYFDKARRQLPREVFSSKAVLITPPAAGNWTKLNIF